MKKFFEGKLITQGKNWKVWKIGHSGIRDDLEEVKEKEIVTTGIEIEEIGIERQADGFEIAGEDNTGEIKVINKKVYPE